MTKPRKTITDYMVSCLSPVFIMLLVGSLVFFLIQVFYHGKTAGSLRWVMFWFVIGIVLVGRIGIEEGTQRSAVFGLGLAAATYLYLIRTNPAFLFAVVLLGIVWWCAHKLTWNCTYVDDDEDASDRGLMETLPDHLRRKSKTQKTAPSTGAEKTAERRARLGTYFFKPAKSQPPGLWVLYFSAAALPLFGLGQMLLAPDDTASRRMAFGFMTVYMAAALGLLLTTSFLGLRRYLRQRYLRMPGEISLGWFRFGAGMILAVLVLALLLPRPGADYTWKTAALAVDAQLRRASDYAVQFNPHDQGKGRAGNEPGGSQNSSAPGANSPPPEPQAGAPPPPGGLAAVPPLNPAPALPSAPAGDFQQVLRALVLVAFALLFGWWLARNWQLAVQTIQAFIQAVKAFLAGLSGAARAKQPATKTALAPLTVPLQPFANYRNPFVTGDDRSWPPEKVIVYTYEAVQAWAKEHGIEFPPQQTPREFCADLGAQHPEIRWELGRLTVYYAHAAYGTHLPANYDAEPVRQIWRRISD